MPHDTRCFRFYVFAPTTKATELTDSFNWLASGHGIAEIAEERVNEVQAYSDYIKNSEFETMNVFEQENNPDS